MSAFVSLAVISSKGEMLGLGTVNHNITEHKRAEEAMRESQQFLGTLVDNIPAAVFFRDLGGRYIRVNRRYAEMFQVTDESVRGKTVYDFFPKDRADDFTAYDREAIEQRRVLKREETFVSQGVEHIFDELNFPILDASGEVIAVGGVDVDITERKRTEEALRDSRERLQAVIDAVPAMISAKDRDSRYLFINRYQAELYGVSRDEAIGKTAGSLLGRRYGAHTRRLDRKVMESGEALPYFEEDHTDAHGVRRALLATKVPLQDRHDRVQGVVTVALDISDRKRAEQALKESETRFDQAARMANLGHWAWDEIEDRCAYCSDELAHIHGVTVDDYLAATNSVEGDLARIHPDDRDEYNRVTRKWASRQDTYDIEYRIVRPDGEVRHVRELAEAIRDETGRMVRSIGTKQDITEAKQAEEALREKTEFLQLTEVITRAANEAESVEAAMQIALGQACAHTGWPVGHAYMLDESAGDLAPSGIWHLENAQQFETFREVTEATRFAPGVGLPGRVLESGKPAWIADVSKDPNFPRAKLATEIGVKGAFAFPVLVGPRVVAVLEFFAVEAVEAYEPLLEVMAQIGTQLGRVLERTRAERELAHAYAIIKGQKERMESELNVGRDIQMSFVPDFSSLPDRSEFSICAALEPALEVGGDFYDSYFLDEKRFCFCIADVSGKGVPAALFMAMAKTLIKSRAADDRSTASILTHVNDELSVDNQACMFVTVFAGILNIRSGELVYTNAGHNPPYIRKKDGTLQRLDQRHGPAIGAMEGMVYKEERDTLEPGDLLFLYTDGVTEAIDTENHLFSEDRLKDLLTAKSTKDAQTAVDHTVAAVITFEGEAERTDDVTVLALEFHGRPEDALRAE